MVVQTHGGESVMRQGWIGAVLAVLLGACAACGSSGTQQVLNWGPAHPLGGTNDAYTLTCSSTSTCALWVTHSNATVSTGVPFQSIRLSYIPVSQKNGAFVQQSPERLPLSGGGTKVGASQLTGSCAGDGSVCMAFVALTYNPASAGMSEHDELFIRRNGSWKLLPLPLPGRTLSASVTGVSCTGRSSCYIAGSTKTAAGVDVAYLARWNGTRWLVLAQVQGSSFAQFHSLSCSAGNTCIAEYDDGQKLDLPYESVYAVSGMSVTELRISASEVPPGSALAAVDCTHGNPCMALLASPSGHGPDTAFRTASISAAGMASVSAPYAGKDLLEPVAFTCFSRTYCIAVMQGSSNGAHASRVSALVWDSGHWQQSSSRVLDGPISAACSAPGVCYVTSTAYAKDTISSTVQSLAQ